MPQQKIVYNWKYQDLEGDSFVSFELKELSNEVLLMVTATVIEDFSDEIPEFKRESCVGGWNYFIKERLTTFLKSLK
nr:SRPBCC domain-containing protein [Kordia sp.]